MVNNDSLINNFHIGEPWAWNLWPGSLGNVSTGGSFFKFSSDIIPYPVNSNQTLKGGRRRRKKNNTSKRRIRRKTRKTRTPK